jgi:hypothetical protein
VTKKRAKRSSLSHCRVCGVVKHRSMFPRTVRVCGACIPAYTRRVGIVRKLRALGLGVLLERADRLRMMADELDDIVRTVYRGGDPMRRFESVAPAGLWAAARQVLERKWAADRAEAAAARRGRRVKR